MEDFAQKWGFDIKSEGPGVWQNTDKWGINGDWFNLFDVNTFNLISD